MNWLEKLERLSAGATEAPWHVTDYTVVKNGFPGIAADHAEVFIIPPGACPETDALRLICHLRNRAKEIRELVAATKRLNKELRELYFERAELSSRTMIHSDRVAEALANLLRPEEG